MTQKNYIVKSKNWIHYTLEENLGKCLTDLKVVEENYH